MALSPDWEPPPREAGAVERFDGVERFVHWATAALMFVCLATAASLYFPALATVVGRRDRVREIHVIAGLLLPVPLLAGVVGRRWGHALRLDVSRFNRWGIDDKFNKGQKLNAAFVAGGIILMVVTGSMMKWFSPFPLAWRTGATFVHDWTATAFVVVITGHIGKALGDREAFAAMRHGPISRSWARRHAPHWLDEVASRQE